MLARVKLLDTFKANEYVLLQNIHTDSEDPTSKSCIAMNIFVDFYTRGQLSDVIHFLCWNKLSPSLGKTKLQDTFTIVSNAKPTQKA